jgi:hypothetical protein
MKNFKSSLLLLIMAITVVGTLSAQSGSNKSSSGTALKADNIRNEPFRDAKIVGELEKGDIVTILKRKLGWMQIKSGKGAGWVRMLSISRSGKKKSVYTAEGLLSLASGRAGTGKVVLTTGIRGLSEENLKDAKFSAEQLIKLESFQVSRTEAKVFAIRGGLVSRSISYLNEEGAR